MHEMQVARQRREHRADARIAPAADVARAGVRPARAQQALGDSVGPRRDHVRRHAVTEDRVDDRGRAARRLHERGARATRRQRRVADQRGERIDAALAVRERDEFAAGRQVRAQVRSDMRTLIEHAARGTHGHRQHAIAGRAERLPRAAIATGQPFRIQAGDKHDCRRQRQAGGTPRPAVDERVGPVEGRFSSCERGRRIVSAPVVEPVGRPRRARHACDSGSRSEVARYGSSAMRAARSAASLSM
ncbi:hypothetical protein [Burkholderia sp. YIM B11467]